MDQGIGAAARLPGRERKDLAIHALAGAETVSGLAARHGVSRKFVYQQTHKAQAALDDAFTATTRDDAVLFELTVTRPWLRQVIVGLALICHSSYRGIVAFLHDLLGVAISVGTVHDVLQAATQQAGVINRQQDLSGIRVGLHDEIFHGGSPCWPASMPTRRIATCWLRSRIATPTPGACICWTPPGKGSVRRIPSPMPDKACARDKGPPGTTRRAMAMCSTSSASAKAWPTRCRALPRVPPRGARRCRPSWTALASGIRTMD